MSGFSSLTAIDILRRQVSQHCFDAAQRDKGIYTLTVPTGGGKTLASLRFALQHALHHGFDRIIYVIPFTSIIDQNAEVVRNILEKTPEESGGIVLEHHSNLTPEEQSWREKILAENWDAPIVFTTMVQLLESLFGAGTRGARRMHQLGRAVLIFDEIQTLPVECVHLFNNALNFLAEQADSTVVLCTATQPLLHKVAAGKGAIRLSPGHELMPDTQSLFEALKRVEVRDGRKPGGWTSEEVAKLALQYVNDEGSCLIVVNTKRAAQEIYEGCGDLNSSERVHLSTSMCPAHRKQQLRYVRERLDAGLPILCVSTQLIEAGVDVDFRVVIRFLAGIDSIAQAAGRCNRNAGQKQGIVHVVDPADENLKQLPDIQAGRDIAQRVLDDFRDSPERYGNDLMGPEAISHYYRFYFSNREQQMSYPVGPDELDRDDTLLNLLSENSIAAAEYQRKNNARAPLHLAQSFMTAAKLFKAIDAPTRGVIVPFGEGKELIGELCGAYEVEKQFKLLRKAQQFTVNVFPHILDRLKGAGAVKPIQEGVDILYLDERYYSEEFGLSTGAVKGMETLNV